MTHYLLLETRAPWEDPSVEDFLRRAGDLHDGGTPVNLFLLHNAVLMGRDGVVTWPRHVMAVCARSAAIPEALPGRKRRVTQPSRGAC